MNDTIMPLRTMPLPRVPPAAWWLLVLLTPNIGFILLRPGVAAGVRLFIPSLLVLAFVAFAYLRTTATTIRWRTELRLQLRGGLPLMVVSGVGVWAHALPQGNSDGLLEVMALMASWPLGASTLVWPLTSAAEQGTLEQYATSPLGRRALIEKYAIAAFLFLISYAQLFDSAMHSPSPPFKMQLFALISAPAFALLFRRTIPALGATMVAPLFCIGVSLALFGDVGAVAAAGLFAVSVVAAVPLLWKRGLLATNISAESGGTFSLSRRFPIALATGLRAQRDAVVFGIVSLTCAGAVAVLVGRAEAAIAMWLFSAVAAATSPALSFAEARANGTLDHELTSVSRRALFARKTLLSLGVVLVFSVALPMVAQLALGQLTFESGLIWLLGIGGIWAMSLFFSVQMGSAGSVVAASTGTMIAMVISTVLIFIAPMLSTRADGHLGVYLSAAVSMTPLLAFAIGAAIFIDPRVRAVRLGFIGLGFWVFSTLAFAGVAMLDV